MASREGVRYGLPHVVRYAHARSTILLPLWIAGLGVSVRVEWKWVACWRSSSLVSFRASLA